LRRQTLGLHKLIPGFAVVLIVLLLAGCAAKPTPSPSPSPSPTPTPTATSTPSATTTPTATATPTPTTSPSPTPTTPAIVPEVYFLTPLYNVTILPGDVTVKIKVNNFNLVNKIGQPNVRGEGHVIYYMDEVPSGVSGIPPTSTPGNSYETADTTYTWKNVPVGSHTFSVQLVNDDGTPLVPPRLNTEPVPVVAPTPSPSETPTTTPTP
jgi:hypothetical protein